MPQVLGHARIQYQRFLLPLQLCHEQVEKPAD